MNAFRRSLVVVAGLGIALALPTLARAGFEDNSSGCSASGTFQSNGMTVDVATVGDDVVTVPRSDTLEWTGSVAAAPGAYHGSIWVELPPPFGTVEIDSWSGNSTNTSNSGVEDYDLPGWLPGGAQFRVAGEHVDQHGTCTGYVNLTIDGGPLGSPITWVALAGTIGLGVATWFAVKPLFVRRVV